MSTYVCHKYTPSCNIWLSLVYKHLMNGNLLIKKEVVVHLMTDLSHKNVPQI